MAEDSANIESLSPQRIAQARSRLAPLTFRRFMPHEGSVDNPAQLTPPEVQNKCFSVLGYLEEYYRTPDHVTPDVKLAEGEGLRSLERQLDDILRPHQKPQHEHTSNPGLLDESVDGHVPAANSEHQDLVRQRLTDLLAYPQVRERFEEEFDAEVAHYKAARRSMREVRDIDRVTEKLRKAVYRRYLDSKQQHGKLTQSAADQIGFFQGKLTELEEQERGIEETASPSTVGYLETQKLLEYKRELKEKGFVMTPSRERLIDRITREALAGKKIFLVGSIGTGKTQLAFYALNNLTGGYEIVPWHEGTTPRDIFGYRELYEDEGGNVQSGVKPGPYPRALEKQVGLVHEEFTGGSTRTQLSMKYLMGAKPGDKVHIPSFNGEVHEITNNFVELFTGNPKDERTKQREEMDPAILRELTGVEVSYMPAAEMNDIIRAMLIEENGVLKLGTAQAEYVERLTKAAEIMQRIHNRDFEGFSTVMKSLLGIDPQGNTETTLNTNFLDPGTLFKLFGEWELAQARGQDFADYMATKLGEFITDPKTLSTPEERKTLQKVLHTYGLITSATAEPYVTIEEQEKGYILPSQMAEETTLSNENPMGGSGSKEGASDIQIAEHQAWKRKFGEAIPIPEPSEQVLNLLENAKKEGIHGLEAHYVPLGMLSKEGIEINGKMYPYPSDWIKPEDWTFEQVKNGRVSADALKLPGGWVVIDGTPKPEYANGSQMYINDPYKNIIERLQSDGKIPRERLGSRFGFSWNEITDEILPEITRVTKSERPFQHSTVGIYGTIGNLFHKEWGEINTSEWFEDKFEVGHRLIGGGSGVGGLAGVGVFPAGVRDDDFGFRPLVFFPQA